MHSSAFLSGIKWEDQYDYPVCALGAELKQQGESLKFSITARSKEKQPWLHFLQNCLLPVFMPDSAKVTSWLQPC